MRLSLLGRGAGRPAWCPGFFSCFVPTPRTPLFEGTTLSEKVAANLICTTMEPRLGGKETHIRTAYTGSRAPGAPSAASAAEDAFSDRRVTVTLSSFNWSPFRGAEEEGCVPSVRGPVRPPPPPTPTPQVPGPGPLRRRGVWEAKLASAAESSSPFRKSRYACFKTERGFQP